MFLGITAQAQNVTTLTPIPFDASGGLSVDTQGNIFLANLGSSNSDPAADEIYKITAEGNVSLFVQGLAGPSGNAFDSEGNLFQTNWLSNVISKITPGGNVTEFANFDDGLRGPLDVAFDSQGNLFATNCRESFVSKFTPAGEGSVFATGSQYFSCPNGVDIDDEDNVYVSNFHNSLIVKITPAGQASVLADTEPWSGADSHNQLLVFTNARLYLASEGARQVLEIGLDGDVSVLAGTGERGNADGPLLEATFTRPMGIDVSPDGRLLYVNTSDPPPVSPLSWTPNLVRVIEIPEIAEEGFQINSGLNDAWYDPVTSGQGFLISVFPDIEQLFLAWFTFDVERPPEDVMAILGDPGHRWLTAQGPYEGDTASLTIYVTEGGVFDSSEPTATTDLDGDGTMTVEFADCASGLVTYEIESLGISGEIPIQRIVSDNEVLCEALANP
jgi:DNA-binding beta-propeller fold protein YncE